MREDLIERARSEVGLRKRMHGDDRSNWSRSDRMMEQLLEALEAAREYVAEADRRVGEQFNKAQRSEAYALEKAAETLTLTKELEAAREDERKWRYAANGPQGTFYTDDLELAAAILRAYDKDDDWTVTDVVSPAIDQARGKGGGEVEGG